MSQYPSAELYDGYGATKTNFIRAYQDTSINSMHIAVHGVSFSGQLDHLYLLFRNGRKHLDTLYGYELLEYQSSVRQVFLTSCYTQSGYQVEGEGIYNLARYFLLNGAERVVTSRWALDDLVTSHSVDLLLGRPDITTEYTQAIKSERKAPYYWAGFMDIRM